MILLWIMFFFGRISSFHQRIKYVQCIPIMKDQIRYDSSRNQDPFEPQEGLTIRTAYELAQKWLKTKEIEDAEESARYLLSDLKEVGSYRYSDFLNSLGKPLSLESITKLNYMLNQRAEFKPIQYILGNWDFYGKTFLCKPPVLIPRPETEELVDRIIQQAKQSNKGGKDTIHILDIGSGSGIIGISLLLNIPNCVVHCIDINEKAISLTKENAVRLLNEQQLKQFYCHYLDYRNFVLQKIDLHHQFDFIVSNPPYIPSKEIATLQKEVRLYEDRVALDGGDDGLLIAREIISTCPTLLKEQGLKTLWLELSREHPTELVKELTIDESIKKLHSYNDFTNQPRFVQILYK